MPDAGKDAYLAHDIWKLFNKIQTLSGEDIETPKCATPSISYGGKKLTFGCATEGVEYVYTIKDADVKTGYDSEVSLTATYEISVYATKTGYDNSDVATATLVWNTATFTETTEPTAVRELTNSHDAPLLIQVGKTVNKRLPVGWNKNSIQLADWFSSSAVLMVSRKMSMPVPTNK